MSRFRILPCLLLLMVFARGKLVYAQLPNAAFYDYDSIHVQDTGRFAVRFSGLGFTKNNEYFNRIADGYTLFGTQINPKLIYTVSPLFQLEGGVFLRDDFGNSGIEQIEPTITFRAKYGNLDVVVGTLDGALNHRIIEPLFDFERVLIDRIENGLQFKLENEKWFADLWVEWETMIYKGDAKQEEVIGGLSLNRRLGDHWEWPLQLLVYHKGGQIDVLPDPLQTIVNVTTGIVRNDVLNEKVSLQHSVYYLIHNDFSFADILEYPFGSGIYLNSAVTLKKEVTFMLSYWKANEFISIIGGQLYPSVSSTLKFPDFRDPNRQILILRYLHDIDLGKGVVLTTRIEPLYDFNRKKVEFSNALYLRYNGLFPIK